MIVFENGSCELEYHPDLKILEARWIGILEAEVMAKMIRKIVEVVQAYTIENILLDATYVEAIKSTVIYEVRVQQYFQQKLEMPTVKRIARIASGHAPYDEAIYQHYLTLIQFNNSSFEFRTFKHHYEAMDWITGK